MDPETAQLQAAGVLPPQQVQHDQQGRQALGDDAGDGHALGGHVAADHKEQVQNHVQHTGNGQIQQRPPGVAHGAHDAVAAVVHGHGRHAQGVYLQVEDGPVHQLVLGVQQGQHGPGQQNTDQAQHHADGGAQHKGRVNGFFHPLPIPHAQAPGHRHVDAAAHADQQSREQRHQQRGGAHGSQRPVVRELAGNGHVAEVEQHLQHLGQHQGQAEQQHIFPQGDFRHVDGQGALFLRRFHETHLLSKIYWHAIAQYNTTICTKQPPQTPYFPQRKWHVIVHNVVFRRQTPPPAEKTGKTATDG